MKKLLLIMAIACAFTLQAQTDGINYQAVIINPDAQQIPGPDVNGTVLAETEVALRFTVLNEDGSVVYQEVIETITDPYGMVNVFIGSGAASSVSNFNEINWDGTPRNLAVELDMGRGFVFLSLEKLTFTPQAYHRDVIADGDLTVEGTATFKSDFIIEGRTIINSDLDVAGDLNVGEDLNVEEDIIAGEDVVVGDDLTVNGRTDLNGNFYVNNQSASILSGRLEVERNAIVNESLAVAGGATIDGDINAGSNLRVAGNQTIGGRSNIVGGQSVGENQTVSGQQIIGGDSRVEGNHTVVLDQRINGNQLIIGDSVIEGGFSVEGDTDINGGLDVLGAGNFQTSITVNQESNLLGPLTVEGATNINDDVTIVGNVSLSESLDVGDGGIFGGDMEVFGKSTVGESLTVGGTSNLGGTLKVNNNSPSFLSGALQVEGRTQLGDAFTVTNAAPSILQGTLEVFKEASFLDDVEIDGMLTVNNNFNVSGNIGTHIAVFENGGSNISDGVAIRIDNASLNPENHFITFFGQGTNVAGRIEGFESNGDLGVVYASSGADYAEWLEKENTNESFKIGEVIGVKGGKISRKTEGADHVLTISKAPIVLGNMPDEARKEDFEKVGFMGQVPALVRGKVNQGDYIVASGLNDGYAIAVSPETIGLEHLKRVIGKAWSSSTSDAPSLINVSVGLKSSEWVRIMESQESRIQEMEKRLNALENLSERLKKVESKIDVIDMN
ncbi:MAG: autotransporter adhesin family protein [Flavobacteriaceae bacterium]|nr:autotransporter adhesin family protein [Flavobacteriaceae bacterium]